MTLGPTETPPNWGRRITLNDFPGRAVATMVGAGWPEWISIFVLPGSRRVPGLLTDTR
jgi:hypothetical protein